MKAVKGFSTPLPLLLVIVGYGIAFWMLTLVVRSVPGGCRLRRVASMGIVMVSVAALFIYGAKLDVPAMLGMALIVLGVVVIQLFLQNRRALHTLCRSRLAGDGGVSDARAMASKQAVLGHRS